MFLFTAVEFLRMNIRWLNITYLIVRVLLSSGMKKTKNLSSLLSYKIGSRFFVVKNVKQKICNLLGADIRTFQEKVKK